MSWSKYHRNCVITGPLDAFCLVCENYVRSEDDLIAHLAKPIHQKNLLATLYFEKYKNEQIRKVKKGYYCEFCNILFHTAAKVGLHIAEPQHNFNKGLRLLKRVGNCVLAFDNVLIEERAWNGFVDNTCVLCNTEFENEDIHKAEQGHVLNLIQKKIDFHEDIAVFRNIDESSYHCLTCNLVLATNTFPKHFEELDHTNVLQKCREDGLKTAKVNEIDIEKVPQASAENSDCKKEVTVEKSKVDKKTKATKADQSKSKEENAFPEKRDSNKYQPTTMTKDDVDNAEDMDRFICSIMDAKQYITRTHDNLKLCILCDWIIDAPFVPAHVAGRHHITVVRLHKERLVSLSRENSEDDDEMGMSGKTDDKVEDDKKPSDEETEDKSAGGDKCDKKDKEESAHGGNEDQNVDGILKSMVEFQMEDIKINFESSTAYCKKCSTSLKLQHQLIQNHIQTHKKNGNQKDSNQAVPNKNEKKGKGIAKQRVFTKTLPEEPSTPRSPCDSDNFLIGHYADRNNLTYKNDEVHCGHCDVGLPSSLQKMKDHITSAQHKANVYKNDVPISMRKAVIKKLQMSEFITSLIGVENIVVQDIIVNEKYNLSIFSFLMITSENSVLVCQSCELNLQPNQVDAHKASKTHARAMTNTMVITNLEAEFVREVRPGVYHCGFCSRVYSGLDGLDDHLNSISHKESRQAAEWRLKEHMNDVAQRRFNDENHTMESVLANQMRGIYESSDDEYE